IYRTIFVKGLSNSHALDVVQNEMSASPERDQILTFIRSSSRGIMKGYSRDED
ncbi:MAG TPA: acyl-[acyl-carrier-protein]--UDP-N-acetylglucosamine O-acyltransferase, partial [Bacteroidia bacterium]|nr:acyl-[acyl-carrier-protein]--UDP-N-acetylglucosamine O-acyltransferase [Bacteroidia bacterium]